MNRESKIDMLSIEVMALPLYFPIDHLYQLIGP